MNEKMLEHQKISTEENKNYSKLVLNHFRKYYSKFEINSNILAIDISGQGTNGYFYNNQENYGIGEIKTYPHTWNETSYKLRDIILNNKIQIVLYEEFEQRDSGFKDKSIQVHSQWIGFLRKTFQELNVKIISIKAGWWKKVCSPVFMKSNDFYYLKKGVSKHQKDANSIWLFYVGSLVKEQFKNNGK